MSYWTIELHQTDSGAWVGVVKRRPHADKVSFMSNYHCTATFAFSDCLDWVKAVEQLEHVSRDVSLPEKEAELGGMVHAMAS